MERVHEPAFEEHLSALRRALKRAREERGACPPWEELRADLLPGGGRRPGRGERLTHLEACPYCDERVLEWRKSFDHTADTLAALEHGVVEAVAGGARGLVRLVAERRARAETARAERAAAAPPAEAPPAAPAPAPTYVARPVDAAPATFAPPDPAPGVPALVPTYQPPQPAPHARPAPAREAGPGRILVVQMADRRPPPESVFLCAAVLEADVAVVDDVRDLANDPDLALVCGVVLGGARPAGEWSAALRTARRLVPGRPAVLLAAHGADPPASARKALGRALIGEDEPAERLLLALDRTLR